MKDSKRTIWSWALYDWANSAFATTVMAGFFPVFFKSYWADPTNLQESTFYLGMANSLASIIVAALAPFLGAVADRGSTKKRFLVSFAFLGVIMTGGLWFVRMGFWQLAEPSDFPGETYFTTLLSRGSPLKRRWILSPPWAFRWATSAADCCSW
ncbi:MAG: MFS transporter [Spirochaetota bacterium]